MQLRDGRKLNRTRYSSWVPSAHMVTGSPQPRTGPSLPSASPIHIELILTRWRVGTLQILLHLLLGFLGFIFLLQHGSVGRLPLQVANEVTHFSATLQKAQDNKAVPGLPLGFPFARGGCRCQAGDQSDHEQSRAELSPMGLQHTAERAQQVPPGAFPRQLTGQSATRNSREARHYLNTRVLLHFFTTQQEQQKTHLVLLWTLLLASWSKIDGGEAGEREKTPELLTCSVFFHTSRPALTEGTRLCLHVVTSAALKPAGVASKSLATSTASSTT